MQGYSPFELVHTARMPFATVQMMNDFSSSFYDVVTQGVIGGKRTRDGKMPGQLKLQKNVPFWSVTYELNRYGVMR